jgi:hypothetical protein
VVGTGNLTSSHLDLDDPSDRLEAPRLRFLPDIDESLVHDPRNSRPAPTDKLSWPQPLTSPDIVTHGTDFAFRYLGLMLRMDMGSKQTISMLNGRVWSACTYIKAHSLNLIEAGHFLREYVYPRLEMGLIFSRLPSATLRSWDSLLRSAVLSVYLGATSPASPALPYCSHSGSRRLCTSRRW